MTRLICCFILSAVALFADVTGKWSGTGKGSTPDGDHSLTVSLDLKQDGGKVTGTVGSGEASDRWTIDGGALNGDVLTFKVSPDDNTYDVTLNISGDTMTGEAVLKRGDMKMTMKLQLKRD